MSRWKIGVVVALVLGLGLTIGAVAYVGWGGLWASVERIGIGGFALYVLYNLVGFLPVGWAWQSVAPGAPPRRWLLFPWGRLVRESASDVLPFSQVGGLVVGIRAIESQGVSEPVALASQIVDISTEMASQLFYTLFGVLMLVAILSHASESARVLWLTILGLVVGIIGLGAFVTLQRQGLDLIAAVVGRWIKNTRERTDAVKATLRDIYSQPTRVISGAVLHGIGWILSGSASWVAFALMGVHIELWKVLTLESLMSAVKSVAFFTPGALGFQEGAYVLVAPIFGLTAEATLAVSLLRRAKDLAIGIPAMLAWQYAEVTARRRQPTPAPEPLT